MTRKTSFLKLIMVTLICFFSTNIFAAENTENLYKTKLVWNKIFSMPVSLKDMGILKTDSYLYLFDENEYYAISLKNINKKSKLSKFKYNTRLRKRSSVLDTFDLHRAAALGDNVYIKVSWFSVNWRITSFELDYSNGEIHHEKTT